MAWGQGNREFAGRAADFAIAVDYTLFCSQGQAKNFIYSSSTGASVYNGTTHPPAKCPEHFFAGGYMCRLLY